MEIESAKQYSMSIGAGLTMVADNLDELITEFKRLDCLAWDDRTIEVEVTLRKHWNKGSETKTRKLIPGQLVVVGDWIGRVTEIGSHGVWVRPFKGSKGITGKPITHSCYAHDNVRAMTPEDGVA